jgi:hypothetical protein
MPNEYITQPNSNSSLYQQNERATILRPGNGGVSVDTDAGRVGSIHSGVRCFRDLFVGPSGVVTSN